jgi:hypothetical protein
MAALIHDVVTFEDWWERCGEAYIRLILSHTMQALLLIGLAQLNSWQVIAIDYLPPTVVGNQTILNHDSKQCYKLDWWFFFPCVWVFVASIMTEFIDTSDMCELILARVPTVPGKSETFKYRLNEEGEVKRVSGGMSKFRKVFITAVVLLPRFGLALAMLIIGGWFLITAGSNTNLLMNCLASNFILDSDELIFEFLTPAKTKRLIEAIPAFEKDELHWFRQVCKRYSFHVKLVVSFATVIVMYYLMPECVLDPCEGAAPLDIKCPIV